jgi:hypothetical protein
MKFCPSFLLALALLFTCNIPAVSAGKSEAVLEAITFQGDAGKGENVRFKLNGEQRPKIFIIDDANPRVVLDFPDTQCSKAVDRAIDAKGKLVKKIRVGIHTDKDPKIRVVVDLAPNGKYQHTQHFDEQAKTLVVTLFSTNENIAHKEKEKKEEKPVAAKGSDAQKPASMKEQASSPKVAESKQPDKTVGGKADEVALSTPSVSASDKINSAVTDKGPEGGTEMPAPDKKGNEPVSAKPLPKQEEGGAQPSEKAVSATREPEQSTAMSHPPETPPAGTAAVPPVSEAAGAKKPAVGAEEKTAAKVELPEKKSPEKEEKAAVKAEKPEKKTDGKKSGPSLSNVTCENTSAKGEMVLFKLNGFYPPTVFGIEKGDPRVVCDFPNTFLDDNVKEVVQCNGKYVESVRITKQTKPNKIRAVLSLVPHKNYDLQQVFFKEDNLFVIIVNSQDALPGVKASTH